MKQLEIRICGRLPAMIESKLPLKVGYETLPEKEKRLLGELLHTALTMAACECILIIPSAGLTPQQLREVRRQIGCIAGSGEWEHETDKRSRLFSVKEVAIIPYICRGLSAKKISTVTGINYNYVRDLFKSIYDKSNCHNKTEFIAFMKGTELTA
jgi:DNA-binding NarL/FixJ family response regulator